MQQEWLPVEENPVHRLLLGEQFASHLQLLCRHYPDWVLCLPAAANDAEWLAGRLTPNLVDAHILRPSPFFKNQYMTVTGTSVRRREDSLVIGDHARVFSVHILHDEWLCAVDTGKTYRIFSVDGLLLWELSVRGPPPSVPSLINASGFSLKENQQFMQKIRQPHASIHQAVQETLKSVQEWISHYVWLGDFIGHGVQRLREFHSTLVETCSENDDFCQRWLRTTAQVEHLKLMLENLIVGSIQNQHVLPALRELFTDHSRQFASTIKIYRKNQLRLTDFGVHLVQSTGDVSSSGVLAESPDFGKSVQLLNSLEHDPSLFTPFERRSCLKQLVHEISVSFEQFVRKRKTLSWLDGQSIGNFDMTADDLIPALAFVIVQSRTIELPLFLMYMQNFQLYESSDAAIEYCLVTLEASLKYLMSDPLHLVSPTSIERGSPSTTNSNANFVVHNRITISASPVLLSPSGKPSRFIRNKLNLQEMAQRTPSSGMTSPSDTVVSFEGGDLAPSYKAQDNDDDDFLDQLRQMDHIASGSLHRK